MSQDTQTIIDAQKDHKDLQEKITALKFSAEKSKREHGEVLTATESLRTEQARICEDLKEDREDTAKILAEAKAVIVESSALISLNDGIIEISHEFIRSLQVKMDTMSVELKKAKEEKEKMHVEIVEEERILSIRKHDLGIYEQRLIDKIAAAGLQDEIKIIL